MSKITFTYDRDGSEVEVQVKRDGEHIGWWIIDQQHRERNCYGTIDGKSHTIICYSRPSFEGAVKRIAA